MQGKFLTLEAQTVGKIWPRKKEAKIPTLQSSSQWFWTGKLGLFSQDCVPRSDLQRVVNTSPLTSGLWQGLELDAKKILHSFIVCETVGLGLAQWGCEKHWLCFPLCVRSCAWGWVALGARAGTVQLPVSRPSCALQQITRFYFYTNVHNFIHFLWLLWQEKEIYDAHHPFIWHRQCLLLREAFSWNWLHNFLLVYCFQVISQDLSCTKIQRHFFKAHRILQQRRKKEAI